MKRLLIPVFLFGVTTLFLLSCQKELSQESNTNNATFSLLNDSTLECLSTPAVNGDYYEGVGPRDVNFVTVVVNVKTTGTYSIASTDKNGFQFADSGFFSSVGLDTLVLKMKGIPILIEPTEFSFGDSTCPFLVDVQDSTGTGLGGVDTSGDTGFADSSYTDLTPAADNEWHFTDSITGATYNGTFADSAIIATEDNVTTLTFGGFTADLSQLFGADLDLPGGAIKTGVYQILNSDNDLGLVSVADGTALYDSDEDIASDGLSNSYVTITSYDPTTRQITGSFHCWSEDENGDNFTLIKGSFNLFVSKQ